eukprot:SAG31_NODE_11131_length_1062_cov_1.885774_1_plen_23_part_10
MTSQSFIDNAEVPESVVKLTNNS